MNHKWTENPNRPSFKETDSVIKKLPTNKSPGQGDFTGELIKTFKEDTNLSPTLPINRRGGNTPNSFYEACFTQLPKPDKDTMT